MSGSRPRKKSRLPNAELQAAGATPGLMVRRISPDGRARLEQLAPEGPERRQQFARRLTRTGEETKASERSE
jgi:hypothetical protein